MKHTSLPLLRLFAATAGRRLALGATLAVLATLSGVALLGLSGWFLVACGLSGAAAASFNVFLPSAGIRLLALGRTAARYGERVVAHDASLSVLAALRERLFLGWATAGAARRLLHRPARMLFRIGSDVDALDTLVLRVAMPVLAALAAAALAGLLVGLLLDARLGLALAGGLLLAGGGIGLIAARRARPLALRRATALERLREQAIDLVAGQAELVMAGCAADQAATLIDTDARLARTDRRLQRIELAAGAALSVAGSIALAGVLLACGALQAEAPLAAMALLVTLAAIEPFAGLRRGAIEAARSALAARRLLPRLQAPARTTRPAPPPAPWAIEIEALHAGHEGARELAIPALQVAAGERVALIGASGVGKSTLLALLAGELTPRTGRLRALPASWLTQRVELFQDSLAGNLRLADPAASDERLWQVLAESGLAEDVRALPRGLATPLGEGGLGLSGGQARRLALARLLLRPVPLWLLDEPTEALDSATAADVLARLAEQAAGRTLVIATHLRREAALADRLLLLGEDGGIAADLRRGQPGFDTNLRSLLRD